MPKKLGTAEALFNLQGRVAVVTGGAGWLGAPMVQALAAAGAQVVILGRREEALRAVSDEGKERGLCIEPYVCDIRDTDAVSTFTKHVETRYGRLDVIVNNAAASSPGPRGLDAPDSTFAIATEIHITAAWRLVNLALPSLRAAVAHAGDASVINIGSMYGKVSPIPDVYVETNQPPNPAYYGAAKAGLLQMTRWLACNLGSDGIRVNSISPGPFPQWDARDRAPDFVAALEKRTALRRVGQRNEVMGAVVFLASRASSFVTGTDIAVDGGWTAW